MTEGGLLHKLLVHLPDSNFHVIESSLVSALFRELGESTALVLLFRFMWGWWLGDGWGWVVERLGETV